MEPRRALEPGEEGASLRRMGYDESLTRGFTLRSTFSLAFAFISPIVALYAIFALSIGAAGPAMWWAFLVVLAGQLLVALVFAELASVLPLAGGVYQWSRQFLGNTFGWFAGWSYMWCVVIAQRQVPKAVLLSLLMVAAIVIYAGLALILAIPNIDAVVAGESTDPITDTLAGQLGDGISKPLFAVIVIGFTASAIALQATAARVIFSFSRDRAFPAAGLLGRLGGAERLPINAVLLVCVLSSAMLAVAGSDFYTTLISFTAGGFFIAFCFPVFAALSARVRGRWRPGPFSLGAAGTPVTVAAFVWLLFETANIAWPRAPDLPWYQNYGVFVMIAILGTLGIVIYLSLRRNITAPQALGPRDKELEASGDAPRA